VRPAQQSGAISRYRLSETRGSHLRANDRPVSDVVIRANRLSKRYDIGALKDRHDTLRDHVVHRFKSLVSGYRRRSLRPSTPPSTDRRPNVIWALKDVSFEVRQGEVVGIIGPNGAGKSTLLKILSRITDPTHGWAEISGRVGSLLEVGTGFHSELTGRENIYLNGAVLGMRKAEIDKQFDEIVAFAGTEKFLETPVKHYSSGMYVRLAFSVAAHMQPDVLIVDEVLAVGDVAFQNKCLGKIRGIAGQGRTVLFVSHNMAAVQGLCSRACLLSAGQIVVEGSPTDVVPSYMAGSFRTSPTSLEDRQDREGTGEVRFVKVGIVDGNGHPIETALCGQDIGIAVSYRSRADHRLSRGDMHITVYSSLGHFLFNCSSEGSGSSLVLVPGVGGVVCHIPQLPLAPGRYVFNLYLTVAGQIVDWVQQAGFLDVAAGDYFGTGQLKTHREGFLVKHGWSVEISC
jgi:lipopolysaccharide transport system ATP-binding protein